MKPSQDTNIARPRVPDKPSEKSQVTKRMAKKLHIARKPLVEKIRIGLVLCRFTPNSKRGSK